VYFGRVGRGLVLLLVFPMAALSIYLQDSRFFGFVPRDDLLGRATVVYWSYNAVRERYPPTTSAQWLKDTVSALARTRGGRIGRRLE
jgi:hypothetical protein